VLAAARATGHSYTVERKLPGGVWGAWVVRDEKRRRAVFKCIWDTDWSSRLESASAVVDRLAERGAQVPRYLAHGVSEDGTWVVQEYLPGRRVESLTPRLLEDVLAAHSLQRDAGVGLTGAFRWVDHVARWMEAHSSPTLAVIERRADTRSLFGPLTNLIGAATPPAAGDDAVHGDFLATQLRARRGRLVGIVDWDGAGVGDSAHDLALLTYNTFAQADRLGREADPNTVDSLIGHGRALSGAPVFAWFLAYEILLALDFVLEHNPSHVGWRAQLGQRTIEAFQRTGG
jgi:aminoglycoside phosphotransferase (APT) family kinase protein